MEELQAMSDAERAIMEIIWENGGSIYIADLIKQVEDSGKDWKRTTIRTFLTRLMEKGFIYSDRQGRMSEYKAAVTREEYLSGQAQSFVNEYFNGSVRHLLASLFGQAHLDAGDADELRRFWEQCREDS